MPIPAKQINNSTEANLLWYIAKELEKINSTLSSLQATLTTTTTVAP
jgi:hypothetical protein